MTLQRFRNFLQSRTAQLASTYLAIIMVFSIGFSIVLYHTSAHELSRQIPPDSFFGRAYGSNSTPPAVNTFFQHRVDQGRSELITRFIFLNVLVLLLGSALSYYLARRSLQPIEQAMDAQAQFVSDASHELRTPLTAIQTSNEVALRNNELTLREAKQLIQHNTDDVVKLKALSDGLLDLAQQQKANPQLLPVSLQDVVSDAMGQVVAQATQKDIAVQDEVADLSVLADAPSLTQVLVILLDNAVKYSNQGGTVYINTVQEYGWVRLEVQDEGIGMRASDVPHIFRRFYRADSSRTSTEQGGYGLGLAIAEQIMLQQHGQISVTSTQGEGSTFSLLLTNARS